MTRFAALFPGQLSEKQGMGEAFAAFPWAGPLLDEVARQSGVDVRAVYFGDEVPETVWRADRNAHVGVFTVSLLALEALEREHGLVPAAAAGYSLGTYAAFVAAGALERGPALDVLLEVLRLLEESPVRGAMGYVIGLSREEAEAAVRQITADPLELSVANENAARQIVVAGEAGAVRRFVDATAPAALRAEVLPIDCPMHTARLAGLAERLERFVAGVPVTAPRRSLFAPMLGSRVPDAGTARHVLGRQIAEPAHWAATLRAMRAEGLTTFLEAGPGDVLAKMLRWTVRDGRAWVVEDPASASAFAAARAAPGSDVARAGEGAR